MGRALWLLLREGPIRGLHVGNGTGEAVVLNVSRLNLLCHTPDPYLSALSRSAYAKQLTEVRKRRLSISVLAPSTPILSLVNAWRPRTIMAHSYLEITIMDSLGTILMF